MNLPFTSVVSYHQNPMTCGVAKFSAELAKRLGVPHVGLGGEWGDCPLLSLKWSEMNWDRDRLDKGRAAHLEFGLFWHDAGFQPLTECASAVFYADPSLGSPGLWCPSLLQAREQPVRLFSFGMAHKLQVERYRRVRELLDAAGKRYHLRVSVGLHEGTSLDDATKHFDALKDIMGPDNVTILGILSDDAVSEELHQADYVLAFFEKGLRANNTTVQAAIVAGCDILTNSDEQTPLYFAHVTKNIDHLREWPKIVTPYSWDALIEAMRKACDKSRSAPVS